jgi:nicotinamide/nicotinate riboside kinase
MARPTSVTVIPYIVGISGPSSSGKTTLARLLQSVCNVDVSSGKCSVKLFILYEDDFYKTNIELVPMIPLFYHHYPSTTFLTDIRDIIPCIVFLFFLKILDSSVPNVTVLSAKHGARELKDWDCIESLDLDRLGSTLRHFKKHGMLPPCMVEKEGRNNVVDLGVSSTMVTKFRMAFELWLEEFYYSSLSHTLSHTLLGDVPSIEIRLCILDGFLLYPKKPDSSTNDPLHAKLYNLTNTLLDLRLFLLSRREQTIRRRAQRMRYATLKDFWADPPGYVEDVVWPNYEREHSWMFVNGNVAGMEIDQERVRDEGIIVDPGLADKCTGEILAWGLAMIKETLRAKLRSKG